MTPQALGALIKRTGVRKSENRKGNHFNYHTEGYSLSNQGQGVYSLSYYSRLSLVRETPEAEQSFNERQAQGLKTIFETLQAKGVKVVLGESNMRIELS
jgi:hypothetical protein